MIVDSSAMVAILLKEPGFELLAKKLLAVSRKGVAAPTLLEASVVLTRRLGVPGLPLIERFTQQFELVVIAFGEAHWRAAAEAFSRFGKGHHPAGLNFGDCMSYATAKLADRSLLFVGDDFTKTDIPPA